MNILAVGVLIEGCCCVEKSNFMGEKGSILESVGCDAGALTTGKMEAGGLDKCVGSEACPC